MRTAKPSERGTVKVSGSQILTPVVVTPGEVGDTIEPWIDAEDLLNVGWFTDGDPNSGLRVRYYRHAGRVWWGGTIEYDGGLGAVIGFPFLTAPPVGYRPDRLTNSAFIFDEDVSAGHITGDWLPGDGGEFLALDTNPTLGDALIMDGVSYRHA